MIDGCVLYGKKGYGFAVAIPAINTMVMPDHSAITLALSCCTNKKCARIFYTPRRDIVDS